MVYNFELNEYVEYNNTCVCIIKKKGDISNPKYIIKKEDNSLLYDINQNELTKKNYTDIINDKWTSFTYNGNNKLASDWVIENIVKKISNISNINFGPNNTNTEYKFCIGNQIWTKNLI